MQEEKVQLKSIKLESLNAECLTAVNRCVRYLKQRHDRVLRLQDSDVLTEISRLARKYNEPGLDLLYSDMKEKMAKCVTQARMDESKKSDI